MQPILSASLINCHAEGMDSIVFRETSPMIRAYICRPDHTLWKNNPRSGELFSVAIHMHRQDITMVPLFGEIYNVFWEKEGKESTDVTVHSFEYSSKIADGKGGFENLRISEELTLNSRRLSVPLFMKGVTMHSVYVPKWQTAAWMICEGHPNNHYSSRCYTNDPSLDKTDFSKLYKPMTKERLHEDMTTINLLSR